MMPSVNGFDVVEALREREETARIPIIVMTAKRITAEDHQRLDGRQHDHGEGPSSITSALHS